METITVGNIVAAVALVTGLITGGAALAKYVKNLITGAMSDQMTEIRSEMAKVEKHLDEVDLENCKNYLVTFLASLERGHEPDEIELERFFEQFQHYQEIGGNSYIRHKVDALKTAGKL